MAERREPAAPPGGVSRVTSLANPAVKEIRGLALPKNRRASGLFVAEGVKLVADGCGAGWRLRRLMFSDRVADQPRVRGLAAAALAVGAKVLSVTDAVLAKVARRDNPQTVIGVFDQQFVPPDSIAPRPRALWVALEQVRDPGNLGSIVRTVDAAGGEGVLLVGETVDPFSIEAVRATMGSIFHVRLARASRTEFHHLRRRWPGLVVGTHLAGTVDYRALDYRPPVLLVMGGEQAGLTPEVAAACETLVRIPMAGRADLLNLAVATGIMLFEIMRGRLRLDG